MLILRIRVDKPKGLQRFCFAWFALRFGVLYKNGKMITLRQNQKVPINKAIRFFQEPNPKPSLIVLPTAWGKSILTAFVAQNANDKLIMLQPSKELLEQNYTKYLNL